MKIEDEITDHGQQHSGYDTYNDTKDMQCDTSRVTSKFGENYEKVLS